MNAREKIFSTGQRWPQEMRIISKMWVDGLLLLRPQIYGERHIGAALEKIIVMATVRACETDRTLCTEAQIAKRLNAPKSNVRRALIDLVDRRMVRRVGNIYAASPDNHGVRIDPARHRELVRMVINAGRELERLEEAA
jgi:hypothetical protein